MDPAWMNVCRQEIREFGIMSFFDFKFSLNFEQVVINVKSCVYDDEGAVFVDLNRCLRIMFDEYYFQYEDGIYLKTQEVAEAELKTLKWMSKKTGKILSLYDVMTYFGRRSF